MKISDPRFPRHGASPLPAEVDLATRLLPLLKALRSVSGMELVFKPISAAALSPIPRRHREHQNPFCLQLKDRLGCRNRCIETCAFDAIERTLRSPEPYLKTCHGGVVEWVEPVSGPGGLEGLLYLGPMRRTGAETTYATAKAYFQRLPILERVDLPSLRILLSQITANLPKSVDGAPDLAHPVRHPAIEKALGLLEKHRGEALGTRELALACGLSPSRFVHLFKEEMHLTFTEYSRGRRLDRARQFLVNTRLTIAEIAADTGWSRQSAFSAAFRLATGVTPMEWRRHHSHTLRA